VYPPLRGHIDGVYAVAFSPDGRRIVTGGLHDTLKLWDVASGKLVRALEKRHKGNVYSVAFSQDGRYIVSGGSDRRVLLWDAQTGDFIRELHRQESAVPSLSFSPDGSRLLTGSSESLPFICYVLAFPSGSVVTRFSKHDNVVGATAFSPKEPLVATAGGNQALIHLWNPDSGRVIRTLSGRGQSVLSVAFARDGGSIAFGNELAFRDITHGGPLQRIVALQKDGDYHVVLDGTVIDEAPFARAETTNGDYALKTRNYEDQSLQIAYKGEVTHTITRDAKSGFDHRCYTFTHDAGQLVSGGSAGILTLYETQTGNKVRDFIGHTSMVWAVAVSPDNRTLVSGSDDQTVRLWDIGSGQNLLTIFVGADNEWIAWTPEGYYTASLNGDRYIGWHVNNGIDKAADYYSVAQFKAQFYRPDVVNEYLRTRDIKLALKNTAERGLKINFGVNSATPNVLTLRPPVPYFIEPEEDHVAKQTDSDVLRVRAAAKKPDSIAPDVASITLLLNGSSQGTFQDRRLEMDVHLQPGENTLAVIATNTEKVPSQPAVIKINYTGKSANGKPKIIFLGIGVAEYQRTGRELRYSDQDVIKVKQLFLSQQNNGVFGEVRTQVLTNRDVNRDTVLDKLEWLKQNSGQGDMVVLFLSGHGGLFEGDYYFYTYQHDGTADYERYDVNWRILIRALNSIKARHAVLFVDTCHAGALGKSKGDQGLAMVLRDFKNSSPGLLVFAASGANELSREMDGNDDRTYGVFTYALIKCLEGQSGILTKDGAIYTDQLGAWLATEVPKLNPDQHPEYTKPEVPGFNHFALFVLPRR